MMTVTTMTQTALRKCNLCGNAKENHTGDYNDVCLSVHIEQWWNYIYSQERDYDLGGEG